MYENNSGGVIGTLITLFFTILTWVALQPAISVVAGLVAIIAGLTTIYKNTKK